MKVNFVHFNPDIFRLHIDFMYKNLLKRTKTGTFNKIELDFF